MSKNLWKFFENFFSKIKTNLILGHFSPFLAILGMVLVKICQKNCKNFSKFFFSKSKQSSFLAILALFRPFWPKFKNQKFQKWIFWRFLAIFAVWGYFWPFFRKIEFFVKVNFWPFLAIFAVSRLFWHIFGNFGLYSPLNAIFGHIWQNKIFFGQFFQS